MMSLALSYAFVFAILGIAAAFDKLNIFNDEGSRKFIHVGVSNWWLLAMFLFDQSTFYLAIIPPATFIVLNAISYRFNLVKPMERDNRTSNDLGTVYYAISLFIITFLAFYFDLLHLGALAILAMGYGDGLGAVLGHHFKGLKLVGNKTLVGFLTVFLVTLIIGLILFIASWPWIILIALSAALIELVTPKGLDNLSLPLGIFLLGVMLL